MSNEIAAASFKIREAKVSDVSALAALHVQTFHETHGMYPDGPTYEIREYQWQKAFQTKDPSWFCFVIEDQNGELSGFAKGIPYNHSDHFNFSGELNKLYILRKYHRLGLGRRLIGHIARKF